jgi:ABC-2 type transport system permease protein
VTALPLVRQWEVLRAVSVVTYKEWAAYRTHSLVSVFVGPVYFVVQYFLWTAVYGDMGTLHGLELTQMIRYFGAATLIGYLTMDFADWNLSMLVRTGRYLTFALRPLHHRFFALAQKVGHRALGFVFEFVPCLLIFVLLFRVDMRPAHVGWLLVTVALAFFMGFYVRYCLGLASFWLVESGGLQGVVTILSALFSGALIPLVFFPHWLQVLQFFLPFQYMVYVPAMVFTGSYDLGSIHLSIPQIVGCQALAVAAMFLLSEVLYRAATRRFTDAGN